MAAERIITGILPAETPAEQSPAEFSPYARIQSVNGATPRTEADLTAIQVVNTALGAIWFAREWVLHEAEVLVLPEEYPGADHLQHVLDTVQPFAQTVKHALPSPVEDTERDSRVEQINGHVRRWGLISPQQNGHVGIAVHDTGSLDFLRQKIGLIVHDYRSPLTSIMGNLKMMRELPHVYAEARHGVVSSASLLHEIVRLGDALLPMQAEFVDMNTMVGTAETKLQHAIDLYRQARGYEPKISVQRSPLVALVSADGSQTLDHVPYTGQAPTILFSETLMELLLNNVGQNIVKAYAALGKRPKDGRRVTLRVGRELANPDRWFFLMDDYAAGFPHDLVTQGVFPHGFTQWGGGVAGTGMGMYSLSRCIAMMDGRLYPANRVGQRGRIVGARTTVLLPPEVREY